MLGKLGRGLGFFMGDAKLPKIAAFFPPSTRRGPISALPAMPYKPVVENPKRRKWLY
jgi:hypothetical protein